jgi:hypothetical protein
MHDQRMSRGEKPCNHHPSPAEEDGQVEAAVLAFVLDEHPDHLTFPELSLALSGASPDFGRRDAIERAIRELVRGGLFHHDGVFVVPSRPALYLHRLEAFW